MRRDDGRAVRVGRNAHRIGGQLNAPQRAVRILAETMARVAEAVVAHRALEGEARGELRIGTAVVLHVEVGDGRIPAHGDEQSCATGVGAVGEQQPGSERADGGRVAHQRFHGERFAWSGVEPQAAVRAAPRSRTGLVRRVPVGQGLGDHSDRAAQRSEIERLHRAAAVAQVEIGVRDEERRAARRHREAGREVEAQRVGAAPLRVVEAASGAEHDKREGAPGEAPTEARALHVMGMVHAGAAG
jgi:hypothetical protein